MTSFPQHRRVLECYFVSSVLMNQHRPLLEIPPLTGPWMDIWPKENQFQAWLNQTVSFWQDLEWRPEATWPWGAERRNGMGQVEAGADRSEGPQESWSSRAAETWGQEKQRQSIFIVRVCDFAHSLKFIYNPETSTCIVWTVICISK